MVDGDVTCGPKSALRRTSLRCQKLHPPPYVFLTQVRRGIGALEVGPEASLRIFHLIADANLELSHLDFASPWVAKAFVERVLRNNYDTLMSYTACTTGAIRGYLHELLMHQVFPKVGA